MNTIINLLFNTRPGGLAGYELWGFLAVAIALIAVFLGARYPRIKNKITCPGTILKKLSAFAVINLVIAGAIFFFRYELIPVLSMRIWMILWIVGMVWYLKGFPQKAREINAKKEADKAEQERTKYFPKK